MTKQQHIKFWIDQAEDDWTALILLFQGKKYLQSLFFAHLVIEKICKALWIKFSESNIPPKTHNINYLLSSINLDIADDIHKFLLKLNRFQIEGRYPEYVEGLYRICNKEFTKDIIDKTEEVKKWLQEKLP